MYRALIATASRSTSPIRLVEVRTREEPNAKRQAKAEEQRRFDRESLERFPVQHRDHLIAQAGRSNPRSRSIHDFGRKNTASAGCGQSRGWGIVGIEPMPNSRLVVFADIDGVLGDQHGEPSSPTRRRRCGRSGATMRRLSSVRAERGRRSKPSSNGSGSGTRSCAKAVAPSSFPATTSGSMSPVCGTWLATTPSSSGDPMRKWWRSYIARPTEWASTSVGSATCPSKRSRKTATCRSSRRGWRNCWNMASASVCSIRTSPPVAALSEH